MHSSQLQPTVLMSVKVTAELQWSATVLDRMVTSEMLPVKFLLQSQLLQSSAGWLISLMVSNYALGIQTTSLYSCTTTTHIRYILIQVCHEVLYFAIFMHVY